MKIKKLISASLAAIFAVSAAAIPVDATLYFPEGTYHEGASSGGNYLIQIYNDGNADKPKIDYGIDVTDIATVVVQFKIVNPAIFEGAIGGSIITSCNSGTMTEEEVTIHNWPSNEWWGVYDEEIGITSRADNKYCTTEKIGDYEYEIICPLEKGRTDFLATAGCVQVGIQEWGPEEENVEIQAVKCLDASGNVMLSFDRFGYPLVSADDSDFEIVTDNTVTSQETTVFEEEVVVKQKAKEKDGEVKERFVKKVTKDKVKKAKKVRFKFKDNKGRTGIVETDKCFNTLKASDNVINAGDDCVFLAYTITDIPEGIEIISCETEFIYE